MDEQINMGAGEFAEWAQDRFGIDYDDVRMWDMLKDLNAPHGAILAEQPDAGTIPDELRSILLARKEARVIEPRKPFVPTPDHDEWTDRGSKTGE